jgi:membrane-anchored glycerophosphoryl diester phosphodiesterase (GDPDase)
MTRDNWWVAAKIFLGLPVVFYAALSVLEPQREIWRKPTKKVLVAFIVVWSAVLCFIAFVFAWNSLRSADGLRNGI